MLPPSGDRSPKPKSDTQFIMYPYLKVITLVYSLRIEFNWMSTEELKLNMACEDDF